MPTFTLLQRYVIEEAVQGCYIGTDTLLNQRVMAVKYAPEEWKGGMCRPEKQAYMERAKRIGALRGKEHLVQVYDVFEEHDAVYVVMQYLEGRRFSEYLAKSGRIAPEKAVEYTLQIAGTLRELHDALIVYGSLCPSSLYLTSDGVLKLLFPLPYEDGEWKCYAAPEVLESGKTAGLYANQPPAPGEAGLSAREAGKAAGLYANQPPIPGEAGLSAGGAEKAADLYALAAVFYRMLTGENPPAAEMREKEDRLAKRLAHFCFIREEWRTAILHAMELDVQDRTPEMAVLIRELQIGSLAGLPSGIQQAGRWTPAMKLAACVLAVCNIGMFAICAGRSGQSAVRQEVREQVSLLPSLVGMNYGEAELLLQKEGVKLKKTGSIYAENMDGDVIVLQEQEEGVPLQSDMEVCVQVSGKEAPEIRLEDYAGKTEKDAKAALEKTGFQVSVRYENSAEVEKGVVIATYPAAGERARRNAAVEVVVSAGAPTDEKTVQQGAGQEAVQGAAQKTGQEAGQKAAQKTGQSTGQETKQDAKQTEPPAHRDTPVRIVTEENGYDVFEIGE